MRKICFAWLVLLAVFVNAVPSQISFQGVLKDSAGSPITGSRIITFNIFPNPDGAGSLWSETQTVSAEAGLYNVKLGSVTPITASIFDGNTKYLGMSIDGSELLPRVMMISVPYAYRADTAATAAHATYADTAGSAGGGNYIQLGPSSQQITYESNAVWVSGVPAGISAEGEYGVYGYGSGKSPNYGVYGKGYYGIYGISADETARGYIGRSGVGVKGMGNYGVVGYDAEKTLSGLSGTYGVIGSADTGVYGRGTVGGSFESNSGFGVYARSGSNYSIYAISSATHAIMGESNGVNPYAGVYGLSTHSTGRGVLGVNQSGGTAVRGESSSGAAISGWSTSGFAGEFYGGLGIMIMDSVAATAGSTLEGTVRYDKDADHFYGYTGTGWKQLDN